VPCARYGSPQVSVAQYVGWIHDRRRKLKAALNELEELQQRLARSQAAALEDVAATPDEQDAPQPTEPSLPLSLAEPPIAAPSLAADAAAKGGACSKLLYHAMAKLFELARVLRAPASAVAPLLALADRLPPSTADETNGENDQEHDWEFPAALQASGDLYGEPQVSSFIGTCLNLPYTVTSTFAVTFIRVGAFERG